VSDVSAARAKHPGSEAVVCQGERL
jgi:hypothetical protein